LGVSLEKAETDTRIRVQYLRALEAEDFQSLPNQVVLRGFLRNYASYLELNDREVADRYSALAGPPEPEPPTAENPPSAASELFRPVSLHGLPSRRWRWGLLGGLIAALVITAAALAWYNYPWITANWFQSKATETTPTAAELVTATMTPAQATMPATLAPAQATDTPKPTARPAVTLSPSASPSPSPSPSPPIYEGVFVEVAITQTSWLQVTVDGLREFQGELGTGEYRSWDGEQRVELRIGNAGGVEVTVNGQKLGTLGGIDEVVDIAFEKQGGEAVIVTPSVTPTGTILPTVTPTPTISPTTTITATAVITATVSP